MTANLLYDGVETRGSLHAARMGQILYARNNILFQAVLVIASALVRQENQEAVMKQVRKLHALINPQDPKIEAQRVEQMKQVLRSEGAKSYKVEVVKLGERSE